MRAPFKDEIGIGCWGKGTSRGRLFGIQTVEIGKDELGKDGVGCALDWDVDGKFVDDNTRHKRFKHAFLSLPGPP